MKNDFSEYWEKYINRNVRYSFQRRLQDEREVIARFRAQWDIPQNGFETKREIKDWEREQKEKPENKNFSVSLNEEELRYYTSGFELVGTVSSGHDERWDRESERTKGFEIKFHVEIRKLIRDLKLDHLWYHPFVKYILLNEVDMRRIVSTGIQVSKRILRDDNGEVIEENVCLTFGPYTRLKDIQLIWDPQVKKLQHRLISYSNKKSRLTTFSEKKYKQDKKSIDRYIGPKNKLRHII